MFLDFKLCCNLFLSKNKHNENLGMGNRYCECLDMINIVHQPLIKECISSKLPQCKNTYSPWGHDDGLREDVGVILVYNQNVLLGGGGIAIFTILSLVCFIVPINSCNLSASRYHCVDSDILFLFVFCIDFVKITVMKFKLQKFML